MTNESFLLVNFNSLHNNVGAEDYKARHRIVEK